MSFFFTLQNSFRIFVKSILSTVLLSKHYLLALIRPNQKERLHTSILICAKSHSRCWFMIDPRSVKISFNLLNDRSQLAIDVQVVNMSCRANLRLWKASLPYSMINFSKSSGGDTKTLDRT